MGTPPSTLTYYQATADNAAWPPLQGDTTADVCIVGAGFAGLGTALSLLERGAAGTVVLEAATVGHGASGRNGGFVFGGFSLGEDALLRAHGPADGRKLYRLTLDAVELIRRRIDRLGIACDAVHGGVYLANWFPDERILDARRRFMREQLGVEWTYVGKAGFAALARTDRYHGALYEPDAFHFHPLKYTLGLARVLTDAGVRVHERSAVTGIVREGAGWRVRTPQGSVAARDVVLCGGGYLGRLHGRLAAATLPIATYIMTTEPLGGRLATVLATSAAIYDTRFAFDYYRPLPDTRLLWGGRIAVRERSAADVARLLYRDMLRVYPQLAGTRVDHAWSGLMSYGRHRMPQMGRLPDGLWYGSGFGGHGVAPTTLCGELLAAALLGDCAALEGFRRWGLPHAGGPFGLGAAQLTYWYEMLRDRLCERRLARPR
ncbi:NAD(P)/FAD-dependent oxidoreductase [Pseudoduganella plicata]|uniref:FAD-binding oxidoreductase n=1 Tax=Pseudoduganella plicata TaxID=321984 RepID=A0A4P7BD46_9BURK|nr:FAD-binding oxidoreductase [Pseudoduganella plicata]QBQ35189.1 FAD-binding oxidoreductase [Pseudoduganella plicata]GGZ05211.1 FAD-binding oxidoreductase [Pseudoduganella plicata]